MERYSADTEVAAECYIHLHISLNEKLNLMFVPHLSKPNSHQT
jgi:hypothetical protein